MNTPHHAVPAWVSLLDALRLVVRLQTGDDDLARGMNDKWIREGYYAFEPDEVREAYRNAAELLRRALQTGRIKGRGQSANEGKVREIEVYEWSGYYCDFRRGGLTNEHEAPKFIRLSQIETEGLLDALNGEREAPSKEAAADRGKGGRKPDLDKETRERAVFDLMDYHGDFSADDPEWNAQARLEGKIRTLVADTTGKEPASSTVRGYVREPLKKWRARKAGRTET